MQAVTLVVTRSMHRLHRYWRFTRTLHALRVHVQSTGVYALYDAHTVVRCRDSYTCHRRSA